MKKRIIRDAVARSIVYELRKRGGAKDLKGNWGLAAVAALMATGQPAFAAMALGGQDLSIGFDWQGGRWGQQNFFTEQLFVQKIAVDYPIAP